MCITYLEYNNTLWILLTITKIQFVSSWYWKPAFLWKDGEKDPLFDELQKQFNAWADSSNAQRCHGWLWDEDAIWLFAALLLPGM